MWCSTILKQRRMESSPRTQAGQYKAYARRPSNPLVVREAHQDGDRRQLRSSTTISNQYVLAAPALPKKQGGQGLPHSGGYWTGQPPNQQASSIQTTPTQAAVKAFLSRGNPLLSPLKLNNSDSTCVDAQNGNHLQPGKENLSLLESYKGQSDSQVLSQNSPTAIDTQQVIIQQGVLIQMYSNRMVQPHSIQYPGTSLSCSDSVQNAQTSSPVTPTTSSPSFMSSGQWICLPQNQRNGSEMSRNQHGVSPPFNVNNNTSQVLVSSLNALGGQALPMLNMDQQSKMRFQYPAGAYLPQQQRFLNVGDVSRMHAQALGNGVPAQNPDVIPQHGNSQSNQPHAVTSVQIMAMNNGVLYVPLSDQTERRALQHGSNQVLSPRIGLHNTKSLNASISQRGASLSVANHTIQSTASCPAPPPYPVRQGFYGTVDQSGNGFSAGNVILMGSTVIQGQQQQGPYVRNASQPDKINVSHQLTHQVAQKKNIIVQQSAAPESSTQHKQIAIAVVQPLSQAQQGMTTNALTNRELVELLLTNTAINTTTDTEAVGTPVRISHETKTQVEAEGLQSTPLLAESEKECPDIGLRSTTAAMTEEAPTLDSVAAKDTGQSSSTEQLNAEQIHSPVFPGMNHQTTLTPAQGKDKADAESDTVVNQVPVNHASKETVETKGPVTLSEDTLELCSVPVVPWRYRKLMALLKKARCKGLTNNVNGAETDVTSTILAHYWEGGNQEMVDKMTSDYYKDLMTEAGEFCMKHTSAQSVIFSHVVRENQDRLKEKCHVLGHNAVYPKMDINKSPWLNTNEQLDDIDKEYGFPWCLKNNQQTLQREEQPELKRTEDDRPEAAVQEVMPQSKSATPGPEPSVASEIQGSCPTRSCSQIETPVQVEYPEDDDLSDPFYSMEIHVLSSEEAKDLHLFDDLQVQGEESAVDQQRAPPVGSVRVDLPEEMDVELTEVESENKVEELMETYCSVSTLKAKQHNMSRSTVELTEVKSENKVEDLMETYCSVSTLMAKQHGMSSGTIIDLTINYSDSEGESDVSGNYAHNMAPPMTEPEWYSGPSRRKVPGPPQMNASLDTTDPGENGAASRVYPCDSQYPSTDKVAYLSTLSLMPRHDNSLVEGRRKSKRRKRCVEGSHSQLPVPKKRRKLNTRLRSNSQPAVHANLSEVVKSKSTETFEEEQQPEARSTLLTGHGLLTRRLTVSLVRLDCCSCPECPQRKHGTVPTGQSGGMQTNPFTGRAPTSPPTVDVSSWMDKGVSVTSQMMKSPEFKSSVKQRLLTDWMDNFVTRMTPKTKRVRPRKGIKEYVENTTPNLPAVPAGQSPARSEQNRSKKESVLNGLKLRLRKAKISPPVTVETKLEIGNPVFRPSQENSVLSFSVLPKSFNFREQKHTDLVTIRGSKTGPSQENSVLSFGVLPKSFNFREQEHTDLATIRCSKTDMDENDAVSRVQKPKAAWFIDSEKKYLPLPSTKPNVSKFANAFKEYQKKYTEK